MMSTQPTKQERREAARQARVDAERTAAASAQRRRRLRMLGIAIGAAVVLVVVAIVVSSGGGSKSTVPPKQKGEVVSGQNLSAALLQGIPQNGIVIGQPNAPLTMAEFADLQCPFCRAYTVDEFPSIVREYVRTGKLKIEFRNFTFIGQDSVTAGQYASAAGQQNKLWNFVDLFYLNQGEENSGYVTQPFLSRILQAVPGLDATKAQADAHAPAAVVGMKTANTLASQHRIDSTPSFLVGKSGSTLQRFPSDPNAATPTVAQFRAKLNSLLAG
jgi:protein-disulfide isomerase